MTKEKKYNPQAPYEVDILGMELDQNLPYWLSPEGQGKPSAADRLAAVRKKHRDAWLLKTGRLRGTSGTVRPLSEEEGAALDKIIKP